MPPLQGAREVHLHRRRREEGIDQWVLLKADLTKSASPEVSALRTKWNIQGVPTMVFLGPDGKESKPRVVQFEKPAAFLSRFPKLRPPRGVPPGAPRGRAQTRFARPSLIANAAFAACRWASFFVAPEPVAESSSS